MHFYKSPSGSFVHLPLVEAVKYYSGGCFTVSLFHVPEAVSAQPYNSLPRIMSDVLLSRP